jgi:hypothetical protein
MRFGQRPTGQGQRQRRLDAEAANGPYWDPRQPLPPVPLVRDAIPAENLPGQRRDEYQRRQAVEEEQLVNYNQLAIRHDRAAARNAQDPDHAEDIERSWTSRFRGHDGNALPLQGGGGDGFPNRTEELKLL